MKECTKFCEGCGDCMECYFEDVCYGNDGGKHWYVEEEIEIEEIEGGDIKLVNLIKGKPYCLKHGAMNKVSIDGIWRCIATYGIYNLNKKDERPNYNLCRAGCLM